MIRLVFSAIFLLCSLNTFSQTGPYGKRLSKAHIGQKIINVIDNSTVGAIQTTLGASHILMYAVLNPISGNGFVSLDFHNNEKSEISQIVINEDIPWFAGAYSLGLFQVGGAHEEHEGGHAVASGALGPLYLPAVGLSYLMEGHHSSLFEEWADLEAESADFGLTGDIKIGLGSIEIGGTKKNVLVLQASIDQTQYNESGSMVSHKSLQWLNTKYMKPLVEELGETEDDTILLEVDLLKKNINLVVDNLAVYLGGDQELRTVIRTEQRYLNIKNNLMLNKAHITILGWAAEFGFEYNLADVIKVTPTVGLNASYGYFGDTTISKSLALPKNYDLALNVGLKFGLDVQVLDYVTWESDWTKEWFTKGLERKSFYTGISNEFRNPMKDIGFLQSVEFDIGLLKDTMSMSTPEGPQNFSMTYFQVGIGLRF